jgi:hypothetical protein
MICVKSRHGISMKRFEWSIKPQNSEDRKRVIERGLGSPSMSPSMSPGHNDDNSIGLPIYADTAADDGSSDDDELPLSCTLREDKNAIIVESNRSTLSNTSAPRLLRFDRSSFSIVLSNPANSYMSDNRQNRHVVVELHPMFLWRLVLNEKHRSVTSVDRDYIRLRTMCSQLISGRSVPALTSDLNLSVPALTSVVGVSVPALTSVVGVSAISRHAITFVFSDNYCECYQSNGRKIGRASGDETTFSDDIVLSCVRRIIGNLRRKTDPNEHLTELFDLCIYCLYLILPLR